MTDLQAPGQTDGSFRSAAARQAARRAALAPAVAVAVTVLVALARLIVTPSFYFVDDTQSGTAGQWWRLGELLLSGRLPLLDVHAWTAGNYLAEGQWGLFNPVIWAAAIFTRLLGDPLVAITAVKIVALAVMTFGTYLLARSFGASRAWAAAAGVLAPLGGFTVYMDAPSWTTGLLASAVLPWAWWGLRCLVEERRGPAAFLIAASVLVTLGYVFGVIVLVLVMAEALVRAVAGRDRGCILRVLGAGVFAAMLTVAVYLPGLLTAPVTVRGSIAVANSGFLNADLTDMLSASAATVTATVGAWWGAATSAPLLYTLWALPAFALFAPARRSLIRLIPLLVVGALLLVLVTGPDQVGPIRWPVRFMPYLVVVVVVAFAAIASDRRRPASARRALAWSLAILATVSWVSAVNTPWQWREVVLTIGVQGVGILCLWFLLFRMDRGRRFVSVGPALLTAGIGVLLVIPQMYLFPVSPLPQLAVVSDTEALSGVPGDVPDDAIVVGNIYAGWTNAATYDERLVANQWYFSDTTVSSLYTVLPHRAYVEDLCADLRGSTCDEALGTLTSIDGTTGRDVASLLGVNTLIVVKSTFPDGLPELPVGWTVARDGAVTWVIVRDDPVPTAGGVVWESVGTAVTEVDRNDTGISLRVVAVGDDAEVVLGRLAWPGYTVEGAKLADSARGYLLTLDLADAEAGDVIVVTFRPPGWMLEITCLVLAGLILVGWPITRAVRSRRHHTESGIKTQDAAPTT